MQVGVDTHLKHGLHVVEVVEHGQHDDPGAGGGRAYPREDLLGPLEPGFELGYHQVGFRLPDEGRVLFAGGGLPHDLTLREISSVAQERRQPVRCGSYNSEWVQCQIGEAP